jgi:hypothetical protein
MIKAVLRLCTVMACAGAVMSRPSFAEDFISLDQLTRRMPRPPIMKVFSTYEDALFFRAW